MPAREEIAAWLRDSIELVESLRDEGAKLWINKQIELIRHRVAQVESVRCETCKYYFGTECPLLFEFKNRDIYNHMGPDFGCFSHEPKPAD